MCQWEAPARVHVYEYSYSYSYSTLIRALARTIHEYKCSALACSTVLYEYCTSTGGSFTYAAATALLQNEKRSRFFINLPCLTTSTCHGTMHRHIRRVAHPIRTTKDKREKDAPIYAIAPPANHRACCVGFPIKS